MNLIEITNLEQPELLIYKQMRDNAFKESNTFVADSPKVVNILLKEGINAISILATKEYYNEFSKLLESSNIDKLYVAKRSLMEQIVGHNLHHNVMMHAYRPKESKLNELDKHIIMLDKVTSTQNVGSIARSAAALGVSSYLLPTQAPHPYSRRSVRVSMGHIALLKTHRYNNTIDTIRALKELGYTVIAAEITKNSTPLSKLTVPKKWVLLMGSEGYGLSEDILKECDIVSHIEMMPEIKSFNVAVAASIIMYQLKMRV